MPSLFFRKSRELEKRRLPNRRPSLIRRRETERNRRPRWKLSELRTKRKEKFRDLESFKRKQLIDKPKLMLSEPRELSRKVKDKQESVKDSSTRRDFV